MGEREREEWRGGGRRGERESLFYVNNAMTEKGREPATLVSGVRSTDRNAHHCPKRYFTGSRNIFTPCSSVVRKLQS